jgi:hypothetical protein
VQTFGVITDAPLEEVTHKRYWHYFASILHEGDHIVALDAHRHRRCVLRVDAVNSHTEDVFVKVMEADEDAR